MEREASGYRYRDESFQVLHTTSVPMTDQEALEYCSLVDAWFDGASPVYVEVRRENEGKYEMLPFRYDASSKRVTRLEA